MDREEFYRLKALELALGVYRENPEVDILQIAAEFAEFILLGDLEV